MPHVVIRSFIPHIARIFRFRSLYLLHGRLLVSLGYFRRPLAAVSIAAAT